jgi:hypothetical protein
MSLQEKPDSMPIERRKEIFLALVQAQDEGMSVEQSRREIGQRFETTKKQIQSIEREGMDNGWPPL